MIALNLTARLHGRNASRQTNNWITDAADDWQFGFSFLVHDERPGTEQSHRQGIDCPNFNMGFIASDNRWRNLYGMDHP